MVVQSATSPKLTRMTYALFENDCGKVRAFASLVFAARFRTFPDGDLDCHRERRFGHRASTSKSFG